MKKTFPGYYRPTDSKFRALWKECLFVPDANVLLNLYRYTPETRKELVGIFQEVSDRLWVPHQAALEYQKQRLEVISQQAEAYDLILTALQDAQKKLENELNRFRRHPFIAVELLLQRIKRGFTRIEKDLERAKQKHPDFLEGDLLEGDEVRNALTTLLEGKVGSAYPEEKLSDIYRNGKARYERFIPPGFKDADKGSTKQYGDLVLWFQIIDNAKETKKPIILITDDEKEDWWWKFRGRTVGPRPELIEEMLAQADVAFYGYHSDRFLEHARKYLKRPVKQESIDEVRVARREFTSFSALAAAIASQTDLQSQLARMAAEFQPATTPQMMEALRQATQFRIPQDTLAALRQATQFRIPQYPLADTLEAIRQAAAEASKVAAESGRLLGSTGIPQHRISAQSRPDAGSEKSNGKLGESEGDITREN